MAKKFIDADILFKNITDNHYLMTTSSNSVDYGMFTTGIKQAIDELPAADVQEVRHGYWKKEKNDVLTHWHCTVCEKCYYLDKPKDAFYCPHCGARMDGEENGII